MSRALLLENPHSIADDVLARHGIEVVRHPGAMDPAELDAALEGVDVLGVRSSTQVSAELLRRHPHLLAIGAFCTGTNQVDLREAARLGIAVFNAPFSNTRSVVELAIAEIIDLARRLTVRSSSLHRGVWDKSAAGSHEVRGLTLGIVGYGNIGTQLSVLAEALGMNVIFYDVAERLALGRATQADSLHEFLERADVVSIHVDGTPGNRGFFGPAEFATMKRGAFFLNLSRGLVVDENALVAALRSGHLGGAGIDVFPTEPRRDGEAFDSPLRGLDNVILTPHVGGSTEEAQRSIGTFVSTRLGGYLTAGSTDMSVNLPQLSLRPTEATRYRVALVHRNTPGVLALVNQTFAEHGANVEGQVLATGGEVGYVLADISSELPAEAVVAVRELEATLRLRVLARPT